MVDVNSISSFGELSMLEKEDLVDFLASEREDRIEMWNEWREATKRPPLDLRGIRLQYAFLQGIDLRWADLAAADLFETDLEGAQLYGANLKDAQLDGVNLDHASLRKACLRGAVLDGASMKHCDLYDADLRDVILDEADLEHATLTRAMLDGSDLRWADLSHAKLRWATLENVALSTAAHLDDLSLFETSFRGIASLRYQQFLNDNHKAKGLRRTWLRLTNRLYESSIWEEQQGRFEEARDVFASLKGFFEDAGDYEAANWAYIREKTMRKLWRVPRGFRWLYPRWRGVPAFRYDPDLFEWIALEFSDKMANYGESLRRPIFWLAMLIVGFATYYWAFGLITDVPGCGYLFQSGLPYPEKCVPTYDFLDALQFSLASTATTDPGEIQPLVAHLGVLTSIQALLGIMLTGLLGFVLGNKLRNS